MNVFIIAGFVGILVIFLGIGLAFLFVRLSQTVTQNQLALENDRSATNPGMTLGYEIPVNADVSEQLAVARRIAAKKAASLPRGANTRIGRLGQSNLVTAGKAIDQDPLTAVKIAAFHTWQGAKAGPPVGGAPQEAVARQPAPAAPTKKPEDLVPGKDYPFTEITDEMSADEVRSARIANAKARSAAIKALKEQAAAAPAAEATAAAPARETGDGAADVAAAAGIEEPDYIEITDDMPADEVRKARIHNARARSAYMKALKEAGVDPTKSQEATAPAPAKTEAPAAEAAPQIPQDIAPPDYVEVTDDMPADEVRKARVQNARERSRFYKALKERGIDPQEWETSQQQDGGGKPSQPEPAAQAAEEAEPAAEAAAEAPSIPDHIAQPDYIEVTDDMSPDDVRQARVHNARERSRFYKALKDAGIDPKSVAEQG